MKYNEVLLKKLSINEKGEYGIGAPAVPFSADLPTYLRITDINIDGTLNYSGMKSVNDINYKNYLLHENDIVFARTGNSTGKNYFYDSSDGELVYAGFLIKFSLDPDKVIPKYIKYYCMSNIYWGWINGFSTGSTRGNINAKTYGNFPILLPSVSYQRKVVTILERFDKKIKLNNQIISTLEEIASTLFKRWFVDFEFPDENGNPYKSSGGKMVDSELGEIPEGWEIKRIGDINITVSDHVANGSFKSLKENVNIVEEESYALFLRNVDLKANLSSQLRYVDKSSYDFLKKSQLFGGEVIISNVADVGTVHLVPKLNRKMVLGNNQIYLNSDITYMNLFMYLFFKFSKGQDLIKSITSGSAQMKFNKTDFRNLKIIVPNLYGMGIFDKIQKKIELTKYENKVLANLRDSLLPKLLSGEIELTDTKEG